jgi:hypothetical protein
MSDTTNNGRKAVYTIIDGTEGRKSRWVRIGVAFENRDGSWNIMLDALPVTGKLQVRDFPASKEDGEQAF